MPPEARNPGQAGWGSNRATRHATGWEIIMGQLFDGSHMPILGREDWPTMLVGARELVCKDTPAYDDE